jgi:hypothetical protein
VLLGPRFDVLCGMSGPSCPVNFGNTHPWLVSAGMGGWHQLESVAGIAGIRNVQSDSRIAMQNAAPRVTWSVKRYPA